MSGLILVECDEIKCTANSYQAPVKKNHKKHKKPILGKKYEKTCKKFGENFKNPKRQKKRKKEILLIYLMGKN